MKYRAPFTLLAAAAGALGIYFATSNQKVPTEREPSSEELPPVEELLRGAVQIPGPERRAEEPQPTSPDEPQLAPKLELSQGQLAWEAKIAGVIAEKDISDSAKSRRLLELIAALPEHGMTTATEEAVKRLPDTDYNAIALPFVTNPQTHGLVESVLFDDLMRRPDAIALPALLRIARIPNHPYARFAHDNLDLLIGEDFGADWLKWEAAIQKSLAAEK